MQPSRFHFKETLAILFRPAAAFKRLTELSTSTWLTPLLVLTLTLILRVLVGGYLQGQAAAMGTTPLPPDWQWWSAEMQNQYMQAQSLTQGPVFLYVIPIATGLVGLWAGWGIVSGLLHLLSTLLGGRGSMQTALNCVGWASLPFAIRDLLRVIFMLSVQRTIISPGLSGFAIGPEGANIFLIQLLAYVDLFLVWHVILLAIGISVSDNLSRGKAMIGAVLVVLLAILTQAAIGYGVSSMGGMMVTRPF